MADDEAKRIDRLGDRTSLEVPARVAPALQESFGGRVLAAVEAAGGREGLARTGLPLRAVLAPPRGLPHLHVVKGKSRLAAPEQLAKGRAASSLNPERDGGVIVAP